MHALELADAMLFLSTLSLRRATAPEASNRPEQQISIHALLAESDALRASRQQPAGISIHALLAESDECSGSQQPAGTTISIHALLAESDKSDKIDCDKNWQFLSTLSLRRATGGGHISQTRNEHFYPRSPCGERRNARPGTRRRDAISIHALLAESDQTRNERINRNIAFLSTLSLRRAT